MAMDTVLSSFDLFSFEREKTSKWVTKHDMIWYDYAQSRKPEFFRVDTQIEKVRIEEVNDKVQNL